MGLYRTVSEINGDFSRKSQLFPPMVYLTPPLKGFPLELSNGAWGQKLEYNDGAIGTRKKFDGIFKLSVCPSRT